MKHTVLILLFALSTFVCNAQAQFKLSDKPFFHSLPIDDLLLEQTNRQAVTYRLSKEEKEFLYLTNYLRKHPAVFSTHCITPFLSQFPEANVKEATSLQEELLSLESQPVLTLNRTLNEVARYHAVDLATKSDQISHVGSGGLDFSRRIALANYTKFASENIYTGKNDPLLSLIMLLLDIGYDSQGHRKNLLNPRFHEMGISIKEHRSGQRIILVQEFGAG